jgi:hypothetical protein
MTGRVQVASGVSVLLVCTLIMVIATTTSQPDALAGRGAHGCLKMHLSGVKKDRLSMLDEECVSWRGWTGRYEQPRVIDLNNPFTDFLLCTDRFDNFPTAWDASPEAAYVRTLYPGYLSFVYEEPSVIVGGDTTKAYPFDDYGLSWGGGYDNYRTPYTYTY